MEKHSQWTFQEESELINFLSDCRVEAEDGANFKQAVWTQDVTHMSTLHPNIAFNATQCSSKWGRVHCCLSLSYLLLTAVQQLKEKFTIVHRLQGISGLGNRWSDAKGMNINLQTKDQWDIMQASFNSYALIFTKKTIEKSKFPTFCNERLASL